MELAESMNEVLSPKWAELRGISIVSVGVSSVNANPEDEERIKKLQNAAASTYGTMAVGEAMLNASQAGGANGTGDANGSGGFMGLAGMAMAGMMANNMSGGQGGVLAAIQRNEPVGEIDAAGELRYDRHEDIVDQTGDDVAKRAADDDTDGHIDHITFQCKLFEFVNHLSHVEFLPFVPHRKHFYRAIISHISGKIKHFRLWLFGICIVYLAFFIATLIYRPGWNHLYPYEFWH